MKDPEKKPRHLDTRIELGNNIPLRIFLQNRAHIAPGQITSYC
jgi:hypothetical protein